MASRKIAAAIRAVTPQPILFVINTGGQDHRWLNNGYFADQRIPIVTSAATHADIADRGGMWASGMEKLLGLAFAGTRIQLPIRTFNDRETLTLGGERIVLIHAGGNTPGDTIVWLPARRVTFVGDLVFVDRLPGALPVSKVKDWLASFDVLAALQPEWVVPGHAHRPHSPGHARKPTTISHWRMPT